MALDPDRIQSLFLKVVALSESDRPAALESVCGGDIDLRSRIEELLRAHQAAMERFVESPDESSDATLDSAGIVERSPVSASNFDVTFDSADMNKPSPKSDSDTRDQATMDSGAAGAGGRTAMYQGPVKPGLVIAGRYSLQNKIGEGGMGEVWLAKQTNPVKRTVALKLIKTGMDSQAVLARFEQERQALALMDHPNIARVLDGGMTPSGQPFFAMDFVDGLPLTKFCDREKMSPRQRLELFVPICQAVQHAHQKGIVHRDLKPANILVKMVDGKPVPKVIDFGVAKATGGKLTDETLSTQLGAVVGTLEYMSPEQAGVSHVDIDTRADIYSLGVVLYELLTGLRPIDSKRLKAAGLAEMIRIIQEEEPSKPSTRLSTAGALPSIAAQRQTEPRKLTALLRGELDWVVLKCLEKQRDRRYETANGLARDLQRYLADETVEARPPSTAYRMSKFLRRNRGPVMAAGLILLALLAGITGTTLGLFRAQRAEADAINQAKKADEARAATEQVNLALQESIQREAARFELARQAIGVFHGEISQDLLLKERKFEGLRTRLLEGAADFYTDLETLLKQHSDTESQASLGQAYLELGLLTEKIGNQKRALEVQQKGLAVARKIAEQSNATLRQRYDVSRRLYFVGKLNQSLGEFSAAKDCYTEAIAIGEELRAEGASTDEVLGGLGSLYIQIGSLAGPLGKVDESVEWFRKAEAVLMTAVDKTPDSVDSQNALAFARGNIAAFLADTGKPEEALALFEKTLATRKQLTVEYPDDLKLKQNLANNYYSIAYVHTMTGSGEDQKQAVSMAASIQRGLIDQYPAVTEFKTDYAGSLDSLGYAALSQGKLAEAFEAYSSAAEIQEEIVAANPDVVEFRGELARFYNNIGASLRNDMTAAQTNFRKALEVQKEIVKRFPDLTAYQSQLAQSYQNVGIVFRFQGDNDQAIGQYRKAIEILKQLTADNPSVTAYQADIAKNLQNIAVAFNASRKNDEAIESLTRAIEILEGLVKATPGDGNFARELGRGFNTMGNIYFSNEEYDKSLLQYRRSREIHQQLATDFPDIHEYEIGLAYSLSGLGKAEYKADEIPEAVASLKRAVELREPMEFLSKGARSDLASNFGLLALLGENPASGISKEEAESYAERALENLKQAVEAGYREIDSWETSDCFSVLRENGEFKQLIEKIREE